MEEIKVTVTSYGGGRALSLYWRDPLTGKRKVVSAKTTDPREAERAAAVFASRVEQRPIRGPEPHCVGRVSATVRSGKAIGLVAQNAMHGPYRHESR